MMTRKIPMYTRAPLLLFCCANLITAQATSRVRIEVLSPLGERLPTRTIHITGEGYSTDATPSEIIELKYGNYVVKASERGFASATLPVSIDQPNQVLTVGLRLGAIEGEFDSCFIYGKITAGSAVSKIRAVELFGSYLVDVSVDANGGYEIRNLACGGQYLLMVMGAETLLKTTVVRAERLARHTDIRVDNNP